jgi:hypothetical protein
MASTFVLKIADISITRVLTGNQRLFTLCQVDYLTDDEHGARDSASKGEQDERDKNGRWLDYEL